jgi:hypothetical protein
MRYLYALVPLLLSALILLTAKQIAQPSPSLRPKIFVIGLSKTGTTSIGDALTLLGYKRLGWKDIRSRQLVHSWANGDYDSLVAQTRYFDAFEDLPWPAMYQEMAEMYPDAKFLLSLRKDEQTWLRSMRTHVGRGEWQPYRYFYGTTQVDGNEETVLASYRNHTDRVREYFQDKPDRYAEICIDDGDKNWEVLCRVAECPEGRIPSIEFPRSNSAASWSRGVFLDNLHWFWSWTITRMEEIISDSVYRGGWSGINALLGFGWKVVDVIELACSELTHRAIMATSEPLTFVQPKETPLEL